MSGKCLKEGVADVLFHDIFQPWLVIRYRRVELIVDFLQAPSLTETCFWKGTGEESDGCIGSQHSIRIYFAGDEGW